MRSTGSVRLLNRRERLGMEVIIKYLGPRLGHDFMYAYGVHV